MKILTWETITVTLIVVVAIFFRTHNLEGKLTFEWDQSRDFAAVEQMLRTGEVPLLGPIVRGDIGGFYLGPLYYYLITPLYYFSDGNPLSLGILSIGVDVVVILLLYHLLRDRVSKQAAVMACLIWAGSPLLIHDAYTPWNASLISVWVILFFSSLSSMITTQKFASKFWLIFLASLISNIHLSLVPVAAALILLNMKHFIRLSLKQYLALLIALLLPLTTLIYSDLTHNFANLRLLKQFVLSVTDKSGSIWDITSLVLQKYGYTIGRLFIGLPLTYLGLGITGAVSLYALLTKRSNPLVVMCLVTILAVLSSLIYYHDFDFAEYYFMPLYVPVIILTVTSLQVLSKYTLPILIGVLYVYLGHLTRLESISPYSLTIKKMVINEIRNLGYPVEVRTNLPRERNTGFPYLMRQVGVTSDPASSRKAYIYESGNLEVISPPEARSIILDRPIQGFKVVVFSN